jgi:DNA-binding SARP family transcriptional activator
LELLDQYLTPQARTAAALAAAEVLADAGELDRAIEMVARVEAHDEIEALIRRACLTVLDGGLDPGRLARWVELVPVERADRGVGHLVRGLLARERDPASSVCWAEFTSAAASFREAGDEDAEIAAIGQLGYLSLITDRLDELMGLFVRVQELVDAGCPAAEPFLAFGAAWLHLNAGEPGEQLAAVEGIADDDVPEAWRLTRDYLRANALMNLGRPDDALDVVPHELRDRAIPLPGALVLEDRLVWLAGRPEEVVRRGIPGLGPGYGARDRFLGGTFAAVVYAFAGRVDDADAAIASTRDAAGNDPGQVVDLQLQALSIVPDVARGFEDRAAATLRSLFALVPIDDPAMRTMFTPHCALPYVLLAETRRFWDGAALGPTFAMGRSLARLLVAFREEGDLGPARLLDWPAPGLLAALLPLPWLIEVTLIGARAGVPAARETGAWALEHWGAPAREILRRQADGSGDLATTAATLLTELPMPPEQKTRISVIGPMTEHYGSHATASSAWRRERVRALLLYLVLHRSSPRERVAEALWPDLPSNKADKNLRTTLSYLHQVLEPTRSAGDAPWYLRNEQGLLVLHDSVEVDLWAFDGLLDEAAAHEREGAPTRALEHYVAALKLWRGALGGGEADHEWADLERTRVQSRLVRAAGRAADLFVATGRPDEAIDTCHVAIAVDRWFEPAYQTLTRAYVELDDLSSARATMQSARAALAEIDQEHTVDPSFPSRARATERN